MPTAEKPHHTADVTRRPVPPTMTAVVARRYGGPEVLAVDIIDVPTPGPGQVLVAVEAAGIDRGTWHLLHGEPYIIRPVFGLRRPKQPVPGLDVTGTVVAVGDEVTRFAVGDVVLGTAAGSLAEYAVAEQDKLVHRPDHLEAEQAAVVSISGVTALTAVFDKIDIGPDSKVLILGASGGVGTYATQMAASTGAHVTGVCRSSKADAVRALGADEVIDYASADPVDGVAVYDVMIDIGGRNPVGKMRRALAPDGTIVFVGGEGGGKVTGGFGRTLRAVLAGMFRRQKMVMFVASEHHEPLGRVVDMIADGTVTPVISGTYALADAADALRDMEAGRLTGKAAIVVAASTV